MTPKRAVDIAAAAAGLVVLAPIFILVGALIAMERGPILFRHERVGLRGRRFRMLKFRTMRPGADRIGPSITADGDPRVTPVGRWLRKTKLDELPQLVNVLLGEMSLVGPRPEVPSYVALYTEAERRVLDLVPGITDPASIAFRDEGALIATAAEPERVYIEAIMPEKIRLNLEYARRATLAADLGVLLQTIGVVAVPRAAQPLTGRVPDSASEMELRLTDAGR